MKSFFVFLTVALTALNMTGRAEDMPAMTKMRVKRVPPRTFLCTKQQLKIEEVPDFIRRSVKPLAQAAMDLKVGPAGPTVTSYLGYRGDPSQSFTAELDIPALQTAAQYKGPFYFRSAPEFKCASMIFQGSIKDIGSAWRSLVEQATEGDLKPTGNSREVYLSWEGEDSDNNVVELQLGVE